MSETEEPFGHKKRDWTTLYRVVVVILSLFSAAAVSALLYAGTSFVRAEATSAVDVRVRPLEELPPRVRRLEEVSAERAIVLKDVTDWRRTKDEIDTRLTILSENQQRQLDRQQTIIDQLAKAK